MCMSSREHGSGQSSWWWLLPEETFLILRDMLLLLVTVATLGAWACKEVPFSVSLLEKRRMAPSPGTGRVDGLIQNESRRALLFRRLMTACKPLRGDNIFHCCYTCLVSITRGLWLWQCTSRAGCRLQLWLLQTHHIATPRTNSLE